MKIPDNELFREGQKVATRLAEAGHEVFYAGGCVRDLLLGRKPNDLDLATSAHPEVVEGLFRRTISVGKQFGVIVVNSGSYAFEVATFRNDGAYVDGRRPVEVTFSTAREDVERRDFTINGLLMNPGTGEIVDYVGGKEDLKAGILRAIGDPKSRFTEDRLRILRALRFATRLEFEIETNTAAALKELAPQAADPSAERVFSELERLFCERDPDAGLRALEELGILQVVLPEVARKIDTKLDSRLIVGVADHHAASEPTALHRLRLILSRLQAAEKPLPSAVIWALILDDLIDDYPQARAQAACAVLQRLKAPKKLQQDVSRLLTARDRLLFCNNPSIARLKILAASEHLELFRLFRETQMRIGQPPSTGTVELSSTPSGISSPSSDDGSIASQNSGMTFEALAKPLLRGDEMMALGVPKGRSLGQWLRRVRYLQLSGHLEHRAAAEGFVKRRLELANEH